jgi:hypothetical protein
VHARDRFPDGDAAKTAGGRARGAVPAPRAGVRPPRPRSAACMWLAHLPSRARDTAPTNNHTPLVHTCAPRRALVGRCHRRIIIAIDALRGRLDTIHNYWYGGCRRVPTAHEHPAVRSPLRPYARIAGICVQQAQGAVCIAGRPVRLESLGTGRRAAFPFPCVVRWLRRCGF